MTSTLSPSSLYTYASNNWDNGTIPYNDVLPNNSLLNLGLHNDYNSPNFGKGLSAYNQTNNNPYAFVSLSMYEIWQLNKLRLIAIGQNELFWGFSFISSDNFWPVGDMITNCNTYYFPYLILPSGTSIDTTPSDTKLTTLLSATISNTNTDSKTDTNTNDSPTLEGLPTSMPFTSGSAFWGGNISMHFISISI